MDLNPLELDQHRPEPLLNLQPLVDQLSPSNQMLLSCMSPQGQPLLTHLGLGNQILLG